MFFLRKNVTVTIPANDFSGSINSIEVKGLLVVAYNFLNLPEKVTKGGDHYMNYYYDAAGRKLAQEVFTSANVLEKRSDYSGEFFYENDTLKFINHEEGRAVMSAGQPEYQYNLKDHLGNVRLTFTTKPEADTFTATFETNTQSAEQTAFQNYSRNNLDLFDHTDAASVYTYSQLLNGGNNSQVGLAKSLSVMPGDTIKVEVFAKYRNLPNAPGNLVGFASALTGAFGLNSTMSGDPGMAYDALDSYGSVIAGGFDHSEDVNAPKAYLNIILFDKNYNFVDAAYKQIGMNDTQTDPVIKAPHGYLNREMIVPEAGYAFIFLSNENPSQVDVYFDDLKITHSKSPVIQMDDYYPFGLTFNHYLRENGIPNRYGYNNMELQNSFDLNWYDYYARQYDATIGRFLSIDPAAEAMRSVSPYAYAFDNPIRFKDPDGMNPEAAISGECDPECQKRQKEEEEKKRKEFQALIAKLIKDGKAVQVYQKQDATVEKQTTAEARFRGTMEAAHVEAELKIMRRLMKAGGDLTEIAQIGYEISTTNFQGKNWGFKGISGRLGNAFALTSATAEAMEGKYGSATLEMVKWGVGRAGYGPALMGADILLSIGKSQMPEEIVQISRKSRWAYAESVKLGKSGNHDLAREKLNEAISLENYANEAAHEFLRK